MPAQPGVAASTSHICEGLGINPLVQGEMKQQVLL